MATSSHSSALQPGRLYKYVSVSTEWKIYFETNYRYDVDIVKNFFFNFHRSHPKFKFVIAKVFDETTHILLDAEGYATVKRELEGKTGRTLPDVSYISSLQLKGSVLTKTFSSRREYLVCADNLKNENEKIYKRHKEDSKLHARKVKAFISDSPSDSTFLAFDTELYEHDRETLLEIGFVEFTLKDDDSPKFYHFIITDNEHIKNCDNVPDNRDKFQFGTSERMSLRESADRFREHIEGAEALVVHGGKFDTKILDQLDIQVPDKEMFDTQVLALALLSTGPRMPKNWGLKRMMGELDITCDESILHNGGNDAAYTMKAFRALVGKIKM